MKTNIQNLQIMVDYNRFKIEEFLEQFQLDETVLIYTIKICYCYNNMFPRSAQMALKIVANLTGNDYDYGVLEALLNESIDTIYQNSDITPEIPEFLEHIYQELQV